MSTSAWDPWNFRDPGSMGSDGGDITGYKVHATDGDIGKVDEASMEVGASQIVVDTGPWIFGRKVLLPAACIERIDRDDEKVYVDRSKDQIKDSPELSEGSTWADPAYREDRRHLLRQHLQRPAGTLRVRRSSSGVALLRRTAGVASDDAVPRHRHWQGLCRPA